MRMQHSSPERSGWAHEIGAPPGMSAAAVLRAAVERLGVPILEYHQTFRLEHMPLEFRQPLSHTSPVQLRTGHRDTLSELYSPTRSPILPPAHLGMTTANLARPLFLDERAAVESDSVFSPPVHARTCSPSASATFGCASPPFSHASAAQVVSSASWRESPLNRAPRQRPPIRAERVVRATRRLRRILLRCALQQWIRRSNERVVDDDTDIAAVALPLSVAEWHIHSLDEITCRSNHSLAWLPNVLAGGKSSARPRSFILPRRFHAWRMWAQRMRREKERAGCQEALQKWSARSIISQSRPTQRRPAGGQSYALKLRRCWQRWARSSRLRHLAISALPHIRSVLLHWRTRSRIGLRAANVLRERLISVNRILDLRRKRRLFSRFVNAVTSVALKLQKLHNASARARREAMVRTFRILHQYRLLCGAAFELDSSAFFTQSRSRMRRGWKRLQAYESTARLMRVAGVTGDDGLYRHTFARWHKYHMQTHGELSANAWRRDIKGAYRRWAGWVLSFRRLLGQRPLVTTRIKEFRLSLHFRILQLRLKATHVIRQKIQRHAPKTGQRSMATALRKLAVLHNGSVRKRTMQKAGTALWLGTALTEAWRRWSCHVHTSCRHDTALRNADRVRMRMKWRRWPAGAAYVFLDLSHQAKALQFWAGSTCSRCVARWQRTHVDSLSVLRLRTPRNVEPKEAFPTIQATEMLLERDKQRHQILKNLISGSRLLKSCDIWNHRQWAHQGIQPALPASTGAHSVLTLAAGSHVITPHPSQSLLFWRLSFGPCSLAARRNAIFVLSRWHAHTRRQRQLVEGLAKATASFLRIWLWAWQSGCVGDRVCSLRARQCRRRKVNGWAQFRASVSQMIIMQVAFDGVHHRTTRSRLRHGFSRFVAFRRRVVVMHRVTRGLAQHFARHDRRHLLGAFIRWIDVVRADIDSGRRSRIQEQLVRRAREGRAFSCWAVIARRRNCAKVLFAQFLSRGRSTAFYQWSDLCALQKAQNHLAVECAAYGRRTRMVRCFFDWRLCVHHIQCEALAQWALSGRMHCQPLTLL